MAHSLAGTTLMAMANLIVLTPHQMAAMLVNYSPMDALSAVNIEKAKKALLMQGFFYGRILYWSNVCE